MNLKEKVPMNTHSNLPAVLVALLLALTGIARVTAAEETDAERRAKLQAAEAAESESELKSAAANQKMRYENYSGIVKIFEKPDPDLPGVVGTFKTKENSFYLKLGNDDLKKSIEALDGKDATLLGWSSNKGKYFVVTGTVSSSGAAPTPSHHKRGGL
jgi:hypothetical protein